MLRISVVVVQALHDELDVGAVQLQEPGPHHLVGEVRPGDAGGLASWRRPFHDQLHDLVQILPVGRKLPAQVSYSMFSNTKSR